MTSQTACGSDVGVNVAIELANLARSNGDTGELRSIFAADPIAVESIADAEAEQLMELAHRSAEIVELLADPTDADIDTAADAVNDLLERFPAQLHLTKCDQGWMLHRHRVDAPLAQAWSAVVAAAFARIIGDRDQSRVGACASPGCGEYFFDFSKNRSRRYCSLQCQNRVKSATYRSRQTT